MKNPSAKPVKGFTLIELLVAMAITTIIITILVSITGLSLDTWNRSRSEIRAARQGKAMIDSMSRDFESMVVRKGNNFEWLYAAFSPTASGPKDNSNKSPNAADLVFFSAATDRYNGNIGDIGPTGKDKGGDVSTVAYQLAYKDPIDGGNTKFNTFVLYRKLVNPDMTFGTVAVPGTLGIAFDSTNASTANSPALLTRARNAAADASLSGNEVDNVGNFICENVYQFTLTFHVEATGTSGTLVSVPVPLGDGTGGTTSILKIAGSGLHMDSGIVGSGVTNPQLKAGRVTSIEVSLTVLTDFGLSQMRKRDLSNAAAKAEFIAKNSYQFSKLIPVPGS